MKEFSLRFSQSLILFCRGVTYLATLSLQDLQFRMHWATYAPKNECKLKELGTYLGNWKLKLSLNYPILEFQDSGSYLAHKTEVPN